jgi:hypothetical protein
VWKVKHSFHGLKLVIELPVVVVVVVVVVVIYGVHLPPFQLNRQRPVSS